jgi:hypothetical protein
MACVTAVGVVAVTNFVCERRPAVKGDDGTSEEERAELLRVMVSSGRGRKVDLV